MNPRHEELTGMSQEALKSIFDPFFTTKNDGTGIGLSICHRIASDHHGALTVGNATLDIPFSGEFDFVDTTYVFPITHMVAPRENVVACNECHTRDDSRLANLAAARGDTADAERFVDLVAVER